MGVWSGEEVVVFCFLMFLFFYFYLLRLVSKLDKIVSFRKKLWFRKKNGFEVLNKYVMQLKYLILIFVLEEKNYKEGNGQDYFKKKELVGRLIQ